MDMTTFVYMLNVSIIWYFLIVNIGYIFLLLNSLHDIWNRFKESTLGDIGLCIGFKSLPPVTALIPAYNEEECIIDTILSLLNSTYPNLRLIVINDGSDDNTLALLKKIFQLVRISPVVGKKIQTIAQVKNYYVSQQYPNLTIIDKEHNGKSDSLNIGINATTTPLFLSIDADTLVEPESISRLVFAMLSQPHTIAEGGAIYVLNGCEYADGKLIKVRMPYSPLISMQACEYLRAFVFGRTGWKPLRGPLVLSGALTLFERQPVIEIGGYRRGSPGEDMEIILHLHERMRANKFPYRIGYSFYSAAWTHVPTNMNDLWAQRDRWHQGLIDSLFQHKRMFFNPRFGTTGMLSYPFQFFAEFLGPIVELLGYIAVIVAMYLNIINWQFAVLFFFATCGFATILTLGATLISLVSFNQYKRLRDVFWLLLLAAFENLGYRQLISLCRVTATARYVIKKFI